MVKRREPWLVVVLLLVTQGWYWFYWSWRVFSEISRARGERSRAGLVGAGLAATLAIVVFQITLSSRLRDRSFLVTMGERAGVIRLVGELSLEALLVATILFIATFAALQVAYLWSSLSVLGPSPPEAHAWRLVTLAGWALFGFAAIGSNLGNVYLRQGTGAANAFGLFVVASLIAALVVLLRWVVHVQRRANEIAADPSIVVPTSG